MAGGEGRRALDPSASLAAGTVSGVVTCVAFQPLDLVKTRRQLGGALATSLRGIVREERSVWALWRGLGPSLARTAPGIGLYFWALEGMQAPARRLFGGELGPAHNFAMGASARGAVALGTLPLTVIKARVESGRYRYQSTARALAAVARTEGPRSLFSGAGVTVLRDAPFSGIYLACYKPVKGALRERWDAAQGWHRDLAATMAAGTVAGTVASVLTQPQDVLKTYCQVDPQRSPNALAAARHVMAVHGPLGLFRGLQVRIVRRTLMAAVSWTVYEQLSPSIQRLLNG
jgi:solute carrier family 25 protein 38